ncbi:unnamed protein product, partial [Schistosoma turkestanicum]
MNPPSACWHCGSWHYVRNCPFRQHRCRKCKVIGHKDGFCLQKKPKRSRSAKKPVPRSSTNALSLISSCQSSSPGERKFITLNINGYLCRMQIDTASDVTILSRKNWTKLGNPSLQHTTQKPRTACGNYLRLLGQLECKVAFRDSSFTGVCYITPADLNLLGLDWFDQLKLADVPLNTICNLVSQRHDPEDHAECYLTTAVRALPVSATDIQNASRNDPIIKMTMKYVTKGWPSKKFEGDIKQLYQRRNSLCIVNDCLMFGERVV